MEGCAEALAVSPWREGWQCTESGLCGANGAMCGPKLGIALKAAEAVSSEISADFGDVGGALSYVVRKEICSIKTSQCLEADAVAGSTCQPCCCRDVPLGHWGFAHTRLPAVPRAGKGRAADAAQLSWCL